MDTENSKAQHAASDGGSNAGTSVLVVPDSPGSLPVDRDNAPYKIGVALSGGGARGFAHVGALLALEQAGIKPDIIAGVSAGSVVAVMYAAGLTPLQIVNHFASRGFRSFAELALGSGGIFRIDKFERFILNAIAPHTRLEDLDIPTYIGATDLLHGRGVAFHTGKIGPRVIASCSIPIVFPPVVIDGVHYVDGGVLRNHPAWMLRDKCRLLIGVNVSPLRKSSNYNSLISVALRTYNLMAKANQSVDMALCDISVQPTEIADYRPFDLSHIKTLVLTGYRHMRQALLDAGLWSAAQTQND